MAWERIGYEVLGSAAASISISVPTPYDFYRITAYIVNDANAVKYLLLRFNGDSGANYATQNVAANGGTVSGIRNTGDTKVQLTNTASIAASQTASVSAIIAKPAAGVKGQVISQAGYNATVIYEAAGGEWNNTAAEITSVALVASSNNFAAGSSFLLEGLAL